MTVFKLHSDLSDSWQSSELYITVTSLYFKFKFSLYWAPSSWNTKNVGVSVYVFIKVSSYPMCYWYKVVLWAITKTRKALYKCTQLPGLFIEKSHSLIRFCLRFIKLHNCTKKIKYFNLLQSSIYGFCAYLTYINDPLPAHLASIHCQSDGWGEAKVSYLMIFVKQRRYFKCTSLNVTYVRPLLWSIHHFFLLNLLCHAQTASQGSRKPATWLFSRVCLRCTVHANLCPLSSNACVFLPHCVCL